MTARRACALLLLPALVALGSCTSSGSKSTQTGSPVPSGMPTDAAGLSSLVGSAVAGITSAHVNLGLNLSATTLAGSGDEQLSGGRLVGLDLTENLANGGGTIRLIVAGGKTYAKLPKKLNPFGKPWLLVSTNSTNPLVNQLAPYLDSALSAVSLGSLSALVGAAKSVTVKGTATIRGTQATHYSIDVEVAKLPASLPGRSELTASGADTLPLELYVADDGRPLRAGPGLTVQGQDVAITVDFVNFNQPVSITAPPSSQVGG
jgi:hypothetical protein